MKEKNKEGMFGPNWWAMHQAARYASLEAAAAGLTVTVEEDERKCHRDRTICIMWRGSEEQFRATKYFSKKPYSFPMRERWHPVGELRGHFYRDGPDQFCYVIEWCHEISSIAAGRHAKQAMQDQVYMRFREMLTEPLPAADGVDLDE
jgi:hypothetical protein